MHPNFTPHQVQLFWSHVQVIGPDDCWLWTGKRTPQGYGRWRAKIEGEEVSIIASKLVYILTAGELEDGYYVCHKCDNPPCCNPAHLFKGTPSQNTQDSYDKGRKKGWGGQGGIPPQCDPSHKKEFLASLNRGEAHHKAVINEDAVREIRMKHEQGHSFKSLAREYGICRQQCARIVYRKRWAHIE